MMTPAAFSTHQKSKAHQRVLRHIEANQGTTSPGVLAVATGICGGVPRIDKFRLAATVVGRRDTFQDGHCWLTAKQTVTVVSHVRSTRNK
jgi:hypothetical protein